MVGLVAERGTRDSSGEGGNTALSLERFERVETTSCDDQTRYYWS